LLHYYRQQQGEIHTELTLKPKLKCCTWLGTPFTSSPTQKTHTRNKPTDLVHSKELIQECTARDCARGGTQHGTQF